jgi:hypothetical protein
MNLRSKNNSGHFKAPPINKLRYAIADQLCIAARYNRTQIRMDTRAGHYRPLV